jgi:hypothetical protein
MKPEYPEKTTDLLTKIYHIVLYQVHAALVGFELTTLLGISTDYIGSHKTDRHDITEILLKVALNTIKKTQMLSFGIGNKNTRQLLKLLILRYTEIF